MTEKKVIHLHYPFTRAGLIRHLNEDHTYAVKPISKGSKTRKADLADLHALVHLGLGR